ncbi:MAG TPA: sulfite reductase subunit alpha [Abditibacteriaceae bacterium]|jgi:sulfite reductase (NADPH) flavoprotein alpha-component
MSSILPENSPFTPQQRVWLDGFLSSSLGLANGAMPNGVQTNNNSAPLLQNGNGALQKNDPPVAKAPEKPVPLYDRDNPFPARVLEVRSLNGTGSAKDTRLISIDLTGSGLTYEAGDALGVYPENNHDLVEEILATLGATGFEPVVTPESRIVPARIALQMGYDISRPSDDLLLLLSETAHDESEAARLKELVEDDKDNWLDHRDVFDVLQAFPSCNASLAEIVASLSPLQPRLYSIASSQKENPTQVHLTVGIVRWHANERQRHGVASTFLADRTLLSPGTQVSVFVHPSPGFRLPENGDTPIIMVGPGTGIAPFRAFMQERRATQAKGPSWLFFGDQKASCDYLYEDELARHLSDGSLSRLDLAFSRDQDEKIYVQTRMLQQGKDIWQWLEEGAHFYICGDAKRMAKDVDAALHQIAREHGNLDEAGAKNYIQSLVKSRRYQRDVY